MSLSKPKPYLKTIMYQDAVCLDCGRTELGPGERFEWHHRDPATKSIDVSQAKNVEQFLEESKKCDLLCSPCHVRRHHELAEPAEEGTLGFRISTARHKAGKAQLEVAGLAGVSRSYLCDLEKGRVQNPSLRVIELIANGIGIPASDLLAYRKPSGLNVEMAKARSLMAELAESIKRIDEILVMTYDANDFDGISVLTPSD